MDNWIHYLIKVRRYGGKRGFLRRPDKNLVFASLFIIVNLLKSISQVIHTYSCGSTEGWQKDTFFINTLEMYFLPISAKMVLKSI